MDLVTAIEKGDVREACRLIDEGGRVNTCDEYGWYPLARSIHSGSYEMIRSLLDRGANPNIYSGWTALMHACDRRSSSIVSLLLDHGADPGVRNLYGNTAASISESNKIANLVNSYPRSMWKMRSRSSTYMSGRWSDISISSSS